MEPGDANYLLANFDVLLRKVPSKLYLAFNTVR